MPAPSEQFDRQVEELAAEFAAVSSAIAGAIATLAAGVASAGSIAALRVAIAQELGLLLTAAAVWVSQVLPEVYSEGVGREIEPGEAGHPLGEIIERPEPSEATPDIADVIEGEGEDPHAEAIAAAQDDLMLALQHAINGIGVSANARLEEIRRRNIARALAQDAPGGAGNALDVTLADEMQDAGITFTDRAGRQWNSEAYARMVLRTHVATALNVGAINRGLEMGSRYVRVSDGGPGDVDEPCRRANGQVWHIAIAAANLLEHPNCRRAFSPLPASYAGPVDRDIESVAA